MADLNEQEIRRLVEEAVQQLGASVSGDAFEEIKAKVTAKGEELDLKVIIQHEAIFNAMHRV